MSHNPHESSEVPSSPTFTSKTEMYNWLRNQTELLVEHMSCRLTPQANMIIALSNVAALYFYELNKFHNSSAPLQHLPVNWFGFYLMQAPGSLALGPFQGRVACTEIKLGRGVCGAAAETGKTIIVDDVHTFPGHIACDSNSRSEIVIPLMLVNGSVVGVIDVDGIDTSTFNQEDGKGLEQLAEVLMKHVEFPMQRALLTNPSLALSSEAAPLAAAEQMPVKEHETNNDHHLNENENNNNDSRVNEETCGKLEKLTDSTRVCHAIPHFTIDVVKADTTEKFYNNFVFRLSRLDRIMTTQELSALESDIHIASFPEIQFPHNTLRIAFVTPVHNGNDKCSRLESPLLALDARAILHNASEFYKTEQYQTFMVPQLSIPVAESWVNTTYKKFDANVDWAWRNNYFGILPPFEMKELTAGMVGINWTLLRDTSLEILLYDAFDFFEDDLHDNGLVHCSVKLRIMECAFFVLFRHFISISNHEMWFREVRYFHEYTTETCEKDDTTTDHGNVHNAELCNCKCKSTPRLIVEEQIKKLSVVDKDVSEWKELSEDALSHKAQTIRTRSYYVDLIL